MNASLQLPGQDDIQVLPHRFTAAVSKHFLGAMVPEMDLLMHVHDDDRIGSCREQLFNVLPQHLVGLRVLKAEQTRCTAGGSRQGAL